MSRRESLKSKLNPLFRIERGSSSPV